MEDKEIACYYYEPETNIRCYFISHTDKENVFLKLRKSYTYEPETNIKRYFISDDDIARFIKHYFRNW